MKNGCGKVSQNDFIPVILAQKRKSPYLAIEIGAAGDSSGSTGNKPKTGLTLSRSASRAMWASVITLALSLRTAAIQVRRFRSDGRPGRSQANDRRGVYHAADSVLPGGERSYTSPVAEAW